jgi:hypothetical protein
VGVSRVSKVSSTMAWEVSRVVGLVSPVGVSKLANTC